MEWSKEEDDYVIRARTSVPPVDYSDISVAINKSASKIRYRWNMYLNPSLIRGEFTEGEFENLKELYKIHGSDWKKIGKIMRRPSDFLRKKISSDSRKKKKLSVNPSLGRPTHEHFPPFLSPPFAPHQNCGCVNPLQYLLYAHLIQALGSSNCMCSNSSYNRIPAGRRVCDRAIVIEDKNQIPVIGTPSETSNSINLMETHSIFSPLPPGELLSSPEESLLLPDFGNIEFPE